MNIEQFRMQLRNVRRSGKGWTALCPAHDDQKNSLKVDCENGKILLKCFAGCDTSAIVQVLGLKMSDLFTEPQEQKMEIRATYDYYDRAGKLVYQTVRLLPKDFRQRRPDGKGGWIWNMQGVSPLPYRLPELIAALERGETVFIPEGEKDVDNLARIGLVATCNHGGAGKWREAHSKYFPAGANVAVLPDNDDPGRKHAEQVALQLTGRGCKVRVLELPGLPEKGDVSDWLVNGGTKEELLKLVAAAPVVGPARVKDPREPQGFSATELIQKDFPDPVWVVPGLVPEGLCLLVGRPKLGKSILALGVAIAVAAGGRALGSIECEKANVVYLALEDGPRRLKERLTSMLSGEDPPEGLFFYNDFPKLDQGGLPALEAVVTKHAARLVIVDTLGRMRPPGKKNTNAYLEDYEVFAALKKIADQARAGLIVVHHQNKEGYHQDVLDSVSGTTGITGAADTILIFKRSRGKADAELFATSRDFEEKELALTFDTTTLSWQYLGNAGEYRLSQERLEIIELLKEADSPLSVKNIAASIGKPYNTVAQLLHKMAKSREIGAVKYGQYTTIDNSKNSKSNKSGNGGKCGKSKFYQDFYCDKTSGGQQGQGIPGTFTSFTSITKETQNTPDDFWARLKEEL